MNYVLKGAQVLTKQGLVFQDLYVKDGLVWFSNPFSCHDNVDSFDCSSLVITPGLVDVHVHLREPGFSFKEDIATGTEAAAAGGFTAVCAMPNVDPCPSTPEAVRCQLDLIAQKAKVRVYPYGAITLNQSGQGELSDMEAIADMVVAFSDDGKGVQDEHTMELAMQEAKRLGKLIVAHCEDEECLQPGGCIHDGAFAREHGYVGISSKSEWNQVKRDLELCAKTGCGYHICHVSTKESVALIRQAKQNGVNVTCETAPHYLMFCQDDLEQDGRWKMNPPLRDAADRHTLLEGILDGTIDCIATDHAPHTAEEKGRGLAGSAFGIVGLETAFASMYDALVLHNPLDPTSSEGMLSLERLIELMSTNPKKRFGIEGPLAIEDGCVADLAVMDLNRSWTVDPEVFKSKGHATPLAEKTLQGKPVMTFVAGKLCFIDEALGDVASDSAALHDAD